jgi:hypothetical protein
MIDQLKRSSSREVTGLHALGLLQERVLIRAWLLRQVLDDIAPLVVLASLNERVLSEDGEDSDTVDSSEPQVSCGRSPLSHCSTYSWTSLRSADSCTLAGAVSVYLERQWSDAVGIVARRDTDGPLQRAPSTPLAPFPKFHSRPVSTTEWSFLGPVRNGDHSVVTF